jgi:uncharacterized protein
VENSASATGTGETEPVSAGPLAEWLERIGALLDDGRPSDVPCAGCTACCSSGQFVHIAPDETDTLAHIPAELLFPAPRAAAGHVLLGYGEDGRCPMLTASGCSIYEHRPRTCRTYDCRVFAATGIEPESDQPAVAARARRWRFVVETHADHEARVRIDAAIGEATGDPGPANALGRVLRALTHATR